MMVRASARSEALGLRPLMLAECFVMIPRDARKCEWVRGGARVYYEMVQEVKMT